ncbi:hypothetical protein NL529_28055, partial [Klebsiella pneumoniae]|nr:hypothetical protein [Klebsiella pneumoniae]
MRRKPQRSQKASKVRRTDELAEAAAAYGQEMVIDDFGPMSKAARDRWERARRKPGRPRRGKGVKVIAV